VTSSPVLLKFFEICILDKYGCHFFTSDLQFGFKENVVRSDALFTLHHNIDYFTYSRASTNVAALYMLKAFYTFNLHALFLKLEKRNEPRYLV
jgi:hypothetical protein